MKKDKDKSLLDDRRFSVALSILLAVPMWMVVTMVINPNSTFTLYNVPVDFTYNSTSYTSKGLDIVNNPEKSVSLKLEGNGYDLSGLKAEDFVVYPDYSSVNGPGEVTLPLRVLVRDSASQVKATVNKDERVSVVFDSVEEKTFTVQVQASDLTIAEGYILQGTVASPSSVTVNGPASEVDSIDRIVARVEPSSDLENMSESKIKTVTLEAQDAQGQPLSLQYTTMDTTVVDVTINIYQTKELPLAVNFINVPEGFDLNTLNYTLSQETMVVSGRPETLESLTELAVSDFDLSTFELDKSYSLTVNLPKGVESKNNVKTITLSFDTTGLASRTLNVANIRTINMPDGYTVKVNDTKVSNVTLIGPEDELAELSPSSVVATVDMSQSQVVEGTENLSASISVPSSSTIFAVGSYSVECSITVNSGS